MHPDPQYKVNCIFSNKRPEPFVQDETTPETKKKHTLVIKLNRVINHEIFRTCNVYCKIFIGPKATRIPSIESINA